jgi:hypothetical protein
LEQRRRAALQQQRAAFHGTRSNIPQHLARPIETPMVRFKNRYLLVDVRAQPAEATGGRTTRPPPRDATCRPSRTSPHPVVFTLQM